LLEELLVEYSGTLLLVSHDREFIDNTVTSTFVFEGPGVINEYVGGYRDWQRQAQPQESPQGKPVQDKKPASTPGARNPNQRELRALPGKIEKLEARIEDLHLRFAGADYYQQEATLIRDEQQQLQALENELADLYQRWEELEG
jgi:ATP-binding cassette subfamily F protein uup